jgi:hypothetical protein
MDWSTIDMHRLNMLPSYTLPHSYHLQKDPGNGCFLDAPGYPTYFTRSVYTRWGNSPRKGPETVIQLPSGSLRVVESSADWERGKTWEGVRAIREKRLRRLWKPLPLEHVRVQAWITYVKGYFHDCYVDPRKPANTRDNASELRIGFWENVGTLCSVARAAGIEVSHEFETYAEDHFGDPNTNPSYERFDNEWGELVVDVLVKTERATLYIQEFYPEYKYNGTTPELYGKDGPGNWWETEAERPTPETCQPRSIGKHPINGTWCQWCGYHLDETTGEWVP